MKITGLLLGLAVAQLSFGSLVYVGPVPTGGSGLGTVNTLVTFSSSANSTDESGCVARGPANNTITGAAACPPGAGPNGLIPFVGGDEQAQNNIYLASALGITDFADIQLIFNASEPGNTAGQSINLENLSLNLFDTDGNLLGAFYLDVRQEFPDAFPGVGNAGFGFQLDGPQATNANFILSAFPDLYIGAAVSASDATGGQETLSIRNTNVPSDPVPEPATSAMMAAAGVALVALRRRLR